jgi:tetratricopeptide (TPR) repeat protein
MKIIVTLIALFALSRVMAQTPPPSGGHASATANALVARGDQADPAFVTYKDGYSLILSEQWSEARAKFRDLLSRYPGSEYADDADYWSAYALMHTNSEKALAAYERFIEQYPHSNYYDDAVADLAQVQATTPPPQAPAAGSIGYTFSGAPNARLIERELRHMSRNMRRWHSTPGTAFVWSEAGEDEHIDQDTRLRMEALYALGQHREDDQAFQTLKGIALDSRQSRPLREAALDGLSGFTKHDVLSVYAEIARTDTNTELQAYAIDMIGQAKDRTKSMTLLIDLFGKLPPGRKPATESVFYSIAEVGNDRAVDFFRNVALTHKDYDLRRDAVYYLGNIGGERARAALYEILKGQ